MSLPIETRHRIAHKFNIKKSGPTWVDTNVLKSDGYAIKDIEISLNKSAIQSYVESTEENMEKLWKSLIDKIEGRTPLEIEEKKILEAVSTPVISEDKPKTNAKAKKSKSE